MENPNILKSLEEFNNYLEELTIGTSDAREKEIYKQSVLCADLMTYSCEVVDTKGKNWIELTEAVNNCFKKIKEKNKIYDYVSKSK
jgi:hypothetical protein